MKQKKFSLRKLKFGLASVAIAFFMLGGVTVAADTLADASSAITAETTANGASDKALAEIKNTMSQPTIPESNAVVGDVVDVTVTAGTPKTTETTTDKGSVKTVEDDITVKTKSIAQEGEVAPKPVVTKTQSSSVKETPTEKVTKEERVTKTTKVDIVTETSTKTEVEPIPTDIVFVIDHSISMDKAITTIENQITTFVNNLSDRALKPRLGLVDYESAKSVNYHTFGSSYFTTNAADFISALISISISGGIESPTVPLTYIATPGNYDWSASEKAKRFAILVTDEGYDLDFGAPSLDDTISKLQAANISTTIIGKDKSIFEDYKPSHDKLVNATGGIYIDIDSDFSQELNNDIANWITKTVATERTYKVTTDHYNFFIKVTRETKAKPTAQSHKPTYTLGKLSHQAAEKQLPQTGDANLAAMTIVGMTLVTAGLVGLKRKKED